MSPDVHIMPQRVPISKCCLCGIRMHEHSNVLKLTPGYAADEAALPNADHPVHASRQMLLLPRGAPRGAFYCSNIDGVICS